MNKLASCFIFLIYLGSPGLLYIFLFICLHWVLFVPCSIFVAACRIQFPDRAWTLAPFIESSDSYPLDHQGSHWQSALDIRFYESCWSETTPSRLMISKALMKYSTWAYRDVVRTHLWLAMYLRNPWITHPSSFTMSMSFFALPLQYTQRTLKQSLTSNEGNALQESHMAMFHEAKISTLQPFLRIYLM